MREITILSGKGGTGKTTITAALAAVAKNAIFCDNDVDAADLHLLLKPSIKETHVFTGAWVATIHADKCTNCGTCLDNCHFDAIHVYDEQHEINPFQCEGCRLCERICPANAITSAQSTNNYWYISSSRFGDMVHAHMGPGEDNSGKLVSKVRAKAREIAQMNQLDYIINDGPPGIGCTAISSITGTNHVLLVIEPTKSGLHDAKRIIELIKQFRIPISALVNKFDINENIFNEIENYLTANKIPLLEKIPFDKKMVEAMVVGKTIVEYAPESIISKKIESVWEYLKLNL